MEEIKKCMRQVKTIISVNCGVIDTAGKILAATNEIGEEEIDPSFRAVVSSDNLFASTACKDLFAAHCRVDEDSCQGEGY